MPRLTLIIPDTPEPLLRPNFRAHWATRAKAVKAARQQAGWIARATHINDGRPRFDATAPLDLTWTIYWPKGARLLDHDNAVASIKAYQDGISDALTEGQDRHYRSTVRQARDEDGAGFTEVIVDQ